jgi:hypothetical protein
MSYAAKAKTQPSFKLLEYCRTNWYHHCQTFPLENTKRSLPRGRGIGDGESVTVYPSLKPGVEVMLKNSKQTSIFDLNIYAYYPLSPLPCLRPRCARLLPSKSRNNACAFPNAVFGSQVLLHRTLYS